MVGKNRPKKFYVLVSRNDDTATTHICPFKDLESVKEASKPGDQIIEAAKLFDVRCTIEEEEDYSDIL